MRICIIGKFPPIQGGVSMRTYWTAYRLAERGHEVHVLTNAKEAGPPFRMHMRQEDWARCEAQFKNGSLTVHWSDPVDRSQSYLPMASPFVSKLAAMAATLHAKRPFDVIYSHYMEPYGVAGHLASEITGVPQVVRMAGSDAGRLWHHPQLEALYDHVLRSAEIVIAGGSVARRAIEHGVEAGRIAFGGGYEVPETFFTPNGPVLDFQALRKEVESSGEAGDPFWGELSGERKHFGVYGKLGETKGSFALLSAMHRLKLAGVDIGLVALAHGMPKVEQKFRQMAQELDLGDRILQIPFLPHWRVPEFLRGCLAVCCLEQDFPIRIHTPVVAREVLLCGCCLVASAELLRKLPGHDRLASGYGCVAIDNVNDVGELTQRLADIANDPEPAAAVGARGHDFARQLERNSDFPQRLEQILSAAAARKPLIPALSGAHDDDEYDRADDRFELTRLCADALRKAAAEPKLLAQGPIDLAQARVVLAAIKKAVAKGLPHLKPLTPAIEIEIAVAEAESALGTAHDDCADKTFARLNIRRWAIGRDDLAQLLPVRHPGLRIVEFGFDAAQYLSARKVTDFPPVARPPASYIVVFRPSEGRRREPLLVDGTTARILQLSDGTLTSLEIAVRLQAERDTSAIEKNLAWVENLFCGGLIGLRAP